MTRTAHAGEEFIKGCIYAKLKSCCAPLLCATASSHVPSIVCGDSHWDARHTPHAFHLRVLVPVKAREGQLKPLLIRAIFFWFVAQDRYCSVLHSSTLQAVLMCGSAVRESTLCCVWCYSMIVSHFPSFCCNPCSLFDLLRCLVVGVSAYSPVVT